jgi:hypothetical protein
MRTVSSAALVILLILGAGYGQEINLDQNPGFKVIFIKLEDQLVFHSENIEELTFISPIRDSYSNIDDENRIVLPDIRYRSIRIPLRDGMVDLNELSGGSPGTFYVSWGRNDDLIETPQPLHERENTLQIVIRSDDSFHGYLMELINTPFIYMPRMSSNGRNQVENRIGSDCFSFVTYGLRRIGRRIPYTNPISLTGYLSPWYPNALYPAGRDQGPQPFLDRYGNPVAITASDIERGIIVSFLVQISVLYEDRGILSILDSEDLLLQSWFDGPHITTFRESGFHGNPVRLFSADSPDASHISKLH